MSQTIIVSILAAFFAIISMMMHFSALNHKYHLLYKCILINNIRSFKDILLEAGYNL